MSHRPQHVTHKATQVAQYEQSKEEGVCCGRKVSTCINNKCLFTTFLVIGIPLLILGILAFVAHFSSGGSMQANFNAFAESIGTDPFILAVFSLSFGTAFTVSGGIGLHLHNSEISDKNRAHKITH